MTTPHDVTAIRGGPVGESRARRIGRWLLVAFYTVAGIGHLLATRQMTAIVPSWVPYPHAVVIVTGVLELAGAIGLLTRRWRIAAGVALAVYALCVWPANWVHAIHDLSTGAGLPIWYHLPRLALQPAIIWWALWASGWTLRRRSRASGRSGAL